MIQAVKTELARDIHVVSVARRRRVPDHSPERQPGESVRVPLSHNPPGGLITCSPILGFHPWLTIGPRPWRNRPHGSRRWPKGCTLTKPESKSEIPVSFSNYM